MPPGTSTAHPSHFFLLLLKLGDGYFGAREDWRLETADRPSYCILTYETPALTQFKRIGFRHIPVFQVRTASNREISNKDWLNPRSTMSTSLL